MMANPVERSCSRISPALYYIVSSVADPGHFDPDPAFHFDTDLDPPFYFNANADQTVCLDLDPDPTVSKR
jgi:hypothetical protein